ncbi:MAG TPA: 3-keto-5-aminohexanoate cleavage protein, partial [Xanthobacteraceae bacterium]|nr:3-keto-5-aminohexanoate cleavage protein [Xanthobacteraceae bacterium]
TSVKQIEGVVRLAKEFGRKIATAEEAHKMMKIGVWYNSVEETLKNLGLPPNPTEYNPGFLLWETDGKLEKGVVGSDSHPIASCLMPPPGLQAAE